MVEYLLEDRPKTHFLIKYYGAIYYILNVFVVLVTAACFWGYVEDDNKAPLVLGILCGAPIFVDILLTISIHILTHRKK